MEHSTFCCLSLGDLYIHYAMIRGNVRQALEAMVGVEERVCIQMVDAAENGPVQILQAIPSILALVRR